MQTTALQFSPALSHGFEGFIDFLRDKDAGASTLSPKRFGDVLSIDVQTLATQAHVHRNTISRAPASESVQKFLREALRVMRAAHDLSGDVGRSIFWYRNEPLPPFGYKTAEQLVIEGRTEDVLRYVSSLEAGAAG
ncbi:hypothetical protein [Limnohabitans planktonicus]|uniref:DUF2384 domain-containing protein n=1 Tax=Limnohabitans planktonicus II-D5 TaxID=1293045 RepID=A0A2T7UHD2_9BURK|nr:hypothetical protein [Limnohabitans planktonicus]PVE44097.1 DUF2384 domain-containing protein [Limnohabitans planktonicus II-D5]|eukprot:gene25662-32142_t